MERRGTVLAVPRGSLCPAHEQVLDHGDPALEGGVLARGEARGTGGASGSTTVPTGVAELWWTRGVAGAATSEGADADRIIKADERKFIDLKRSAIQFTKERVFIDHVLCEI